MTGATVSYPQPRLRLGRWALGATAVLFGVATLVEGTRPLRRPRRSTGGRQRRLVRAAVQLRRGLRLRARRPRCAARRSWATWIARALAVATLVVFVAFGVHVLAGGAFELRTVIAMTLRPDSGSPRRCSCRACSIGGCHEGTLVQRERRAPLARCSTHRRTGDGGFVATDLPADSSGRLLISRLHTLGGATLMLLTVARLVVRRRGPAVSPLPVSDLHRRGVGVIHALLYVVTFGIGATGFVTGARSAWPDYLRGQLAEAPALEALASREAHEALVFALLGLVLLHVGGVMLQQVRQGGCSGGWCRSWALSRLLAREVRGDVRGCFDRLPSMALGLVRRGLWGVVLVAVVLLVAWFRVWSPVRVEVAFASTAAPSRRKRSDAEPSRASAKLPWGSTWWDGSATFWSMKLARASPLGQELALAWRQTRPKRTFALPRRASAQHAPHCSDFAAEEERARALATAEREATRTQALADAGAVPGQQRDEASDRLRVARAELDRVLAQRSERRLVASTSRRAVQNSGASPWYEPRYWRPLMAS